MLGNEPAGLPMYGFLEDLEKITPQSAAAAYQRILKDLPGGDYSCRYGRRAAGTAFVWKRRLAGSLPPDVLLYPSTAPPDYRC